MTMCLECGSWNSKTLETRKDTRHNWKYRRRKCNNCQHVFETYEIDASIINPTAPVNPDGRLERR
jgi:transcriptional regulator NrdR family protein